MTSFPAFHHSLYKHWVKWRKNNLAFIIKEKLHRDLKIWLLFSQVQNNISIASTWHLQYIQTTNEEKADKFHCTMNSLHPRLKYEIQSFLEFKVTFLGNGESSFETSEEIAIHAPSSQPYPETRRSTLSVMNEEVYSRDAPTSNKHNCAWQHPSPQLYPKNVREKT